MAVMQPGHHPRCFGGNYEGDPPYAQGGNFHLKVGEAAKSSGNVGDSMLGVAVIP